jgi:hypothetical protein
MMVLVAMLLLPVLPEVCRRRDDAPQAPVARRRGH